MQRASSRIALALGTALLCACGTLASPSTGDVDLPESFVGPLQVLNSDQRPTSSQAFIRASESGINLDDPSVVRVADHRVAFMSYFATNGPSAIGRADERADRPALSLQFDAAVRLLSPEKPWEGASISSPSVVLTDAMNMVMAYQGEGGIGIARSADGGMSWTRSDAPVLTPDASHGEGATLGQPSLSQNPAGGWYMLYASGGAIFAASATDPSGPWARAAGPMNGAVLAPVVDADAGTGPDGGVAGFESSALGDPALAIVTTAAGRSQYALYYTALGPSPNSVIAGAGSFDGIAYSRLTRPAFALANTPLRVGSIEVVDERTILVWISTVASGKRVISVLIGPPMSRGSAIN